MKRASQNSLEIQNPGRRAYEHENPPDTGKSSPMTGTIKFPGRHAVPYFPNINHILDKIVLLDADMADSSSLLSAIKACRPDEIYHLAAQSYVGVSFTQPTYTGDITGLGVTRLLESVRSAWPSARIY